MMKRPLLIAFSICAFVTALVMTLKQQDHLATLRAESSNLGASRDDSLRVTEQPASDIAPASANDAPPSLELLRLRAEVTRLNNRKRELGAALQKEEQQSQTLVVTQARPGAIVLPEGYIRRSEAKFSGYNSPEETIQSMLWAIQNRNIEKLMEAFSPEMSGQMNERLKDAESIETFFKEAGVLPGMKILGKESKGDGQMVLTTEILPGEDEKPQIKFKQFNGQWKIVTGF